MLFDTRKRFAVEFEVGIYERFAQIWSGTRDGTCGKVMFYCAEISFLQDTVEALDVSDLSYVYFVELQTQYLRVLVEVYDGQHLFNLVETHYVFGNKRVAHRVFVHKSLCYLSLESEYLAGNIFFFALYTGYLVVTRKFDYIGQVLYVSIALRLEVLFEIIVSVADTEPRLPHPRYALFTVVGVGLAEDAKQRRRTAQSCICQICRKVGQCFEVVYFFQVGFDGFRSLLFDSRRVHTEVVQVAYLLLDRAFGVVFLSNLLDDAFYLLAVVFTQFIECAEACIFVRQRIFCHPASAGVLVKVFGR